MTQEAVFKLFLLSCLLLFQPAASLMAQIDPVGEISLNSERACYGVAEKDGYVYLATQTGSFAVYDVRSLSIDGPFKTFAAPLSSQAVDSPYGLVRNGNFLYLYGYGIKVFDITNPGNPLPGAHLTSHSLRNLVKSGDYLFGTGPDVAVIYSLANPANPVQVATTSLGGRLGFAIAHKGSHIYVGELVTAEPTYRGLRVLSWDGGSTLASILEQPIANVPYHLFVRGLYLVDTDGNGIRIWSLADPAKPVMISETVASGRAAFQWGNLLVTNGRVHRLHGSQVAEFATFTAGQSQTSGYPYGAAGNADFVFIGQHTRALILTAPPTMVFPQYASGLTAGDTKNRTRVILSNDGSTQASGVIRFLTNAGAPNPVWIGGVTSPEVPYSIPPRGTFQLLTDGTGGLTFGPLEIRPDTAGDSSIRGVEVFDLLGHNASVPAAPLSKTHVAFVSWTTTENTALAIYNPSLTTAVQARAELFGSAGASAGGPRTVDLAPRQQTAIFIDDPTLFQSILGGGSFEGTLKLTVTSGGPVSVTSLIQKRGNGSLLVVPVESSVVGP